jgi:hypothetical protein
MNVYTTTSAEAWRKALPPYPAGEELQPLIIHMDSLGCHQRERVATVFRNWLLREWCARRNGGQPLGGVADSFAFTGEVGAALVKAVGVMDTPEQTNSHDCGVFTLRFAELMMGARRADAPWARLAAASVKRQGLLPYPGTPFCMPDIRMQREVMREVVELCARDQTALEALSAPRAGPDAGDKAFFNAWLKVYNANLTHSVLPSQHGTLALLARTSEVERPVGAPRALAAAGDEAGARGGAGTGAGVGEGGGAEASAAADTLGKAGAMREAARSIASSSSSQRTPRTTRSGARSAWSGGAAAVQPRASGNSASTNARTRATCADVSRRRAISRKRRFADGTSARYPATAGSMRSASSRSRDGGTRSAWAIAMTRSGVGAGSWPFSTRER